MPFLGESFRRTEEDINQYLFPGAMENIKDQEKAMHQRRDVTVLSMHDAIQEDVELGALAQGYVRHQVPTPEWIGDRQLLLARRIRDLRHDHMAHRLSQLKGMIASKQPAEKQISAWQEELASLETALNT
mgnify:CR=1 FL=1